MTTVTHTPPTLRARDEADELVVEIDLPRGPDDGFDVALEQGMLTVRIPHGKIEHEEWRIHADATPC